MIRTKQVKQLNRKQVMKNKFEENQIQTTIANSIQKSKQLALDLNGAISRGNVLLNQFNQMRRQHFLYSDGRLRLMIQWGHCQMYFRMILP